MEKWQIKKSKKLEIPEISEKLFLVFDFTLQPKSKTRTLKSQKKFFQISEISNFSEFLRSPWYQEQNLKFHLGRNNIIYLKVHAFNCIKEVEIKIDNHQRIIH